MRDNFGKVVRKCYALSAKAGDLEIGLAALCDAPKVCGKKIGLSFKRL